MKKFLIAASLVIGLTVTAVLACDEHAKATATGGGCPAFSAAVSHVKDCMMAGDKHDGAACAAFVAKAPKAGDTHCQDVISALYAHAHCPGFRTVVEKAGKELGGCPFDAALKANSKGGCSKGEAAKASSEKMPDCFAKAKAAGKECEHCKAMKAKTTTADEKLAPCCAKAKAEGKECEHCKGMKASADKAGHSGCGMSKDAKATTADAKLPECCAKAKAAGKECEHCKGMKASADKTAKAGCCAKGAKTAGHEGCAKDAKAGHAGCGGCDQILAMLHEHAKDCKAVKAPASCPHHGKDQAQAPASAQAAG